jgi:hypothetical protein
MQCFDILKLCFMIGSFFCSTVKGTVLRNNVFFFNMLWGARCTVQQFITKSIKS